MTSQNISFPSAAQLITEGRPDLLSHAGQRLATGDGAQAYASYINGHLAKISPGATYADLAAPETAAKAAVTAAVGQPAAQIATLQATADGITNTRNTLFKGETLRGLLLSAYAWSTVGTIAGIAAIGAFIAAGLMAILVGLGIVHQRRTPKNVEPLTSKLTFGVRSANHSRHRGILERWRSTTRFSSSCAEREMSRSRSSSTTSSAWLVRCRRPR